MWSTEELAALGKVVMNFTALDACTDRLLAGFISETAVAEVIVAGESIDWKLDKLQVIAADQLGDSEAKRALLGWIQAARQLKDRRNQITHSWFFDEGQVGSLTRMKASTRGGKWKGQSEPLQLDQIRELVSLIGEGLDAAHAVAQALSGTGRWHGDLLVVNSGASPVSRSG
jgi:hypothetical protein